MADYSQVKLKIIEVLGWFTRDAQFASRYSTRYTAATRLNDPNLGITPLAFALMAQPVNAEVGPLVAGWVNLGVIDMANCGATTVGEFIEFICAWGNVSVPPGEPT